MLTPRDIETREFSRARSGYKTEEVEAFLDEILADYTKLLEERDSYAKRVLLLSEKVEKLRDDQQNGLKEMLEANFKSRDEIVSEAKKQAAQIIAKAENDKANALIQVKANLIEAEAELQKIKNNKNALSKEVDDFKALLVKSYETHLKMVNNLPVLAKETVEEPAPAHAPIQQPAPVVEQQPEIKEPVFQAPEEPVSAPETEPEPIAEPEVEEDFSETIIMKPVAKPIQTTRSDEASRQVQEDDDADIIFPRREKATRSFIRNDEDKIKDLFAADDKKKKNKPFKKSKFLKQTEDDDFFDDDFDDE